MLVTDLGLELRGVPQDVLTVAQHLLDLGGLPVEYLRFKLRRLCPDQPLAEAVAQATLRVHRNLAPGLESEGCLTCHHAWPCPDVQAANRTLWLGEGRVPR